MLVGHEQVLPSPKLSDTGPIITRLTPVGCASLRRAYVQQALEAVEKLGQNLLQEQRLLVQSMCAQHQRVLSPPQARPRV